MLKVDRKKWKFGEEELLGEGKVVPLVLAGSSAPLQLFYTSPLLPPIVVYFQFLPKRIPKGNPQTNKVRCQYTSHSLCLSDLSLVTLLLI